MADQQSMASGINSSSSAATSDATTAEVPSSPSVTPPISPTAADRKESHEEEKNKRKLSIIEEIDLNFGSAKNKAQIIHALETSTILHRIPVSSPNVTTEQAFKDFKRERVLLNDVPFIPDKVDLDRCHAFSFTLTKLLERMMMSREGLSGTTAGVGSKLSGINSSTTKSNDQPKRQDEKAQTIQLGRGNGDAVYDREKYASASAIADCVLQRACRTSAGAESFFMVQKMLCVEGTFVTQRAFLSDPPIKIDIFLAAHPQQCGDDGDVVHEDGGAGPAQTTTAGTTSDSNPNNGNANSAGGNSDNIAINTSGGSTTAPTSGRTASSVLIPPPVDAKVEVEVNINHSNNNNNNDDGNNDTSKSMEKEEEEENDCRENRRMQSRKLPKAPIPAAAAAAGRGGRVDSLPRLCRPEG
mmetsp:Transcript_7263/g.12200  ORF Transcript_7263/g.12200 Transcript_7263/m.12200 type:complete len:413 (-) Transcript_7263:1350-2588(-)